MTYTELKQAIQDFASNYETSFVSHIDQFIKTTEHRIIADAQLPLEQNATTLSTAIGVSSIDVSGVTGYLSVDSIAVTVAGEYRYLYNKDEEYMREAFPLPSATGVPRLYNVYDDKTLKLAPTPNAVYPLELRYYSYPTSIVSASTSWLGTNFDQALLYGALRDAAVYLKEEADVVAMYEAKYQEGLAQVKAFGDKRGSLDSYRTRG
jgi:hypothetical protein